ncbi:PEAR1 protein, partial [Polypterus senegalus]
MIRQVNPFTKSYMQMHDIITHVYSVTAVRMVFMENPGLDMRRFGCSEADLVLGSNCKSNGKDEATGDLLFNYPLNVCGGKRSMHEGCLMYENVLHSKPEKVLGVIRRKQPVNIALKCCFFRYYHVYKGAVHPTWSVPSGVRSLHHPSGMVLKIMDATFSKPSEAKYHLGQEIHFQAVSYPNSTRQWLFLHSCYATPNPNPNSRPQYTVIDNYGFSTLVKESYAHPVDHVYEEPCADTWNRKCTRHMCQEECPVGWYGKDCTEQCNCENGARCYHINGACLCAQGFTGPRCNQRMCPDGFYGMKCDQACLCQEEHTLRFQKENLTIGECKDEFMVAIGPMTLLMDSEGKYRKETVSHADADRDKKDVGRALIHEFKSRYESLKSCDHFLIFDPTTWPLGMKDLHSFGNIILSNILETYEASKSFDRVSTLREWMRLKQAGNHLVASSVHNLVNVVKTSKPGSCSNIQKVLLLSLTLPLSSAACEM